MYINHLLHWFADPPGLQVSSHQPRVCKFKSNISSQSTLLRHINQPTRQTGGFNELIKVWIGAFQSVFVFFWMAGRSALLAPVKKGQSGITPPFCSHLNSSSMGSIKTFTPLALMEHILITGNSTVQRFNLRSKMMWCIGIRQAGLSLWHCGLMDALWLKEKNLPLPAYAQSFAPPPQLALITSGHWLDIELEIVGNRGQLFLVLHGGIYFFHLPFPPTFTNPPCPNYYPPTPRTSISTDSIGTNGNSSYRQDTLKRLRWLCLV